MTRLQRPKRQQQQRRSTRIVAVVLTLSLMSLFLSISSLGGRTVAVKAWSAFGIPPSKASAAAIFRRAGRGFPVWVAASTMATSSSSSSSSPSSTAALHENPLLQQDGLPRFQSIQPKYLTPAVDQVLSKMNQEFEDLEVKLTVHNNDSTATTTTTTTTTSFEEIIPQLEKIQFPIGYVWGVAGHLHMVKDDDELREAYEANQPKVVQALTKFSQSKPIYDALKALEGQWAATASPSSTASAQCDEQSQDNFNVNSVTMESESFEESQKRRAVELSLKSMTLGGVGLEGEAKERFNQIKMRLAELGTTFSNNLLDATKSFELIVEDPEIMKGVPASAKGLWASSYVQSLKQKGGDESLTPNPEQGPWRVTLDGPSYIAAMSHIPDRATREKIYRAQVTRASQGEKNNVPIIYETLQLRLESAKLLGFANHAERSLSSKMASSVASVQELADMVAAKALPAAQRELAEVTALARAQGGDEYSHANLSKLAPWDITFWSERLKESKFDMTDEELRPYFALDAVLNGLFDLVHRIFDIQVKPADGEAEVWHPDVRFFNVYSGEGKHIASFYLDPFSRPENKRGGAWMDVCIGKSEAMNRDIPVAYLTCNGSPPVGDKPSLMTFDEVTTLFHEFGHGLQHMLTQAKVGDVSGINGVEWDAVELPSQFMENWCYDKATVYGFAKHWQTGEPLPEDLFVKLQQQKTFNAGMFACRQLYLGQMDMELHSSSSIVNPDDDTTTNNNNDNDTARKEGESIFEIQRRVASKYVPHAMPLEEDRFLCSFSHIFAGGYSAGYYSYLWAEVMSSDAFAAFEEVGLDQDDPVKRVGKLFRDTVLALGGGVPPLEVYKRFRGREPRPEALLRHKGFVDE